MLTDTTTQVMAYDEREAAYAPVTLERCRTNCVRLAGHLVLPRQEAWYLAQHILLACEEISREADGSSVPAEAGVSAAPPGSPAAERAFCGNEAADVTTIPGYRR